MPLDVMKALNEIDEPSFAEKIRKAIGENLHGALDGSIEAFRYEVEYVRWGAVEKAIYEATDRIAAEYEEHVKTLGGMLAAQPESFYAASNAIEEGFRETNGEWKHWAVCVVAASFSRTLQEAGAANFWTSDMQLRDPDGRKLTVTIQVEGGITPAQRIATLEAEIAKMRPLYDAASEHCDALWDARSSQWMVDSRKAMREAFHAGRARAEAEAEAGPPPAYPVGRDWTEDVREFHKKFAPSYLVPAPIFPEEGGEHLYSLGFIAEEFEELKKAIGAKDLPEVADALVDLIYVAIRFALIWGIDLRPIWDGVHEANMKKEGGQLDEGGKLRKPEGWQPPDIAGLLERQKRNAARG